MKKETFDRAAQIDTDLQWAKNRLKIAKETQTIKFLTDPKESCGSSRIQLDDDDPHDKPVFAVMQKAMERYYQAEVNRLQKEFDKIK